MNGCGTKIPGSQSHLVKATEIEGWGVKKKEPYL